MANPPSNFRPPPPNPKAPAVHPPSHPTLAPMDLLDLGGLALPPVNADLPPTPSQHPASAPSGDTSLLDLDVLGSADSSFSAAAAPSLAVDLMSPGVDSFAAGESESSTIASDLLSPSPVPGANGSLLVDLGGGEPTEGPETGEQVEGGSSFEGSLAGLSLSLVDPATSPSPVPSPPSSLVSSPEPLVTRVRGSSHDHPSKHSHRHEPPASYRAAVALQKWEALYATLPPTHPSPPLLTSSCAGTTSWTGTAMGR